MNSTMRGCVILLMCGVAYTTFLRATATAKIIHVPGDSATIQAGIDGALPGDTVLVSPGTYAGVGNRDLNFGGTNLVLLSEGGPEVTIIDVGWVPDSRGMHFYSGEDLTAVVDGFTITHGYTQAGAGILCTDLSSPSMRNCFIVDNIATDFAECEDCGTPGGAGGGIACIDASPTISYCLIASNHAEDGASTDGEDIYPAQGAGIALSSSDARFFNVTIASNAPEGISIGGTPLFAHCLITFNDPGVNLWCGEPLPSEPTLTCCNMYGNSGGDWVSCLADQLGVDGNVSRNPAFCARAFGDYLLAPFSPCLPGTSSCAALIGALGPGCTPLSFTGDLNFDSMLELSDLVLLGNVLDGITDLSGACGDGAGDVDADGDTDEDDYNLLYDVVASVGP